MGLDMYLTGHYYIWSEDRENIDVKGIDLHGFKLKNIEIELGYWRKANHIHKWFVDNIQKGIDECQESYVSKDDLRKLLSHCKKVLEKSKLKKGMVRNGYKFEGNKKIPIMTDGKLIKDSKTAEELLPTVSGFFFGNTDYNEYYFRDIEDTIKIIEKALKLPKGWSIYYNSNW